MKLHERKDISIVLCGAAGQGIKTVEQFLTHVIQQAGYNVSATKEYMSRVRGGTNSTEIRVSEKRVCAFVDRIDIFIPLDKSAIPRQKKRLSESTLIIGEEENVTGVLENKHCCEIIEIPFTEYAKEIGSKIYANVIAAGVIIRMFKVNKDIAEEYLRKRFSDKGENVLTENFEALRKGFEIAEGLLENDDYNITLAKNEENNNDVLYNGAEIVGLGAIAGGCNFICSYPMSPSTGVLNTLARYSDDYEILVEQAEDEIAAINASLGASYAGSRAMITTSGGGFALMSEGISLAGIIETPIVMHLAQRPGPATGLPTRTEQGDLELALYSGHGDFPRIILSPGTLEDGFFLTQKAFNLAAKFQSPVIILTDQFFMDLYYNFPPMDISDLTIEKHVIKTKKDYQRYKLTDNGLSPRGIPAFGDGFIRADSDEHDEDGFITEDLDETRINMVNKRFNKLEAIKEEVLPPELIGPEKYDYLVIGWGSTFTAIEEALEEIGNDKLAFLFFKQVYPVHEQVKDYLQKAKKVILIENNATGQFGKLLLLNTGFQIENKILKFNGMPFSKEELVEKITAQMEEK
jgi:2-oxoglutarate ferredoxin oxidoreductase subunit alpha